MTQIDELGFYMSTTLGGLSLLATTLVIAAAFYVEPSNNTRLNLVFCMMSVQWFRAFIIVCGSITMLNRQLEDFTPGLDCSVSGFFIQQTLVAADITSVYIGVYTWVAFAMPKKFTQFHNFLEKHFTITFFFPWVLGTIIGIIAAYEPGYIPIKSSWCTVSSKDNYLWRWIFLWGSRLVFTVLLTGFYGHILVIIVKSRKVLESTSEENEEHSIKLRKAARKLLLYPLIYIAFRLPAIIDDMHPGNRILLILHNTMTASGLADALVYGYSEDLRSRLVLKWHGAQPSEFAK